MGSRTLPLIGAAALGFAAAALGFSAWAPRAASAQFRGVSPVFQPGISNPSSPPPQPLEIQALDKDHFVVATREPRLVAQIGREGAQNMLVTVVTHYTVTGDRLVPMEHVRVPTGYRQITLDE